MPTYKYLIIGGGMTADQAVRGIREVDPNGSIGLIGAEPDPPYRRPPLSKGLWGPMSLDQIWLNTGQLDVTLHLERTAQKLDVERNQVIDDRETVYTFEKLLLATGGTPRRLPFGQEHILYYRTVQDYHGLRQLAEKGERLAVIGGGFIGSELAASLRQNDQAVIMAFPETGIGGLSFPPDLAHFLNDYYQKQGVDVWAGEMVSGLEEQGGQLLIQTKNGREALVDGVVAGIGIEPNTELAEQAGLTVDNGIVVDELLRTDQPHIYAAGDVANFYNPLLDTRLRVEHEDNANTMGRHAGRAMAGETAPYQYLPFFYSTIFDMGYEAIGQLDTDLEIVTDWHEPYQQGTLYYLDEGRLRGVILWNMWGRLEAAQALMAESGPFSPEDLAGRIG